MDHFKTIYSQYADIYHRMIAAEDMEGNLLPAMEHVLPLSGKRVLDLGTGTGRIPLMLHKRTGKIFGLDLHEAMLLEQQKQQYQIAASWDLLRGDLRALPFASNYFDVVTAGWALGHFQDWYKDDWQEQVDRALREMRRVTLPEGALVIIETLTTGSLRPAPPTQGLARYYTYLENQWDFKRQEIQTDYQFQDLEEAVRLAGFFFGDELAKRVREHHWVRLPEWTGVWSRRNL